MDFYPEYVQVLYAQHQNGVDTDCSFEFEVPSENGGVVKKVVHGHKVILSAVSEYFKANLKPEWGRDQPIPITNCEHSVFEKLIKAIYLSTTNFEDLNEGYKLYEAADFYCIEGALKVIREEIIKHWKSHRSLVISPMVNLAFKYGDDKLKHFLSKVFAQNANYIITELEDFYKYSYEAINFFFQMDDLSINELDLLRGLENYNKRNIDENFLQPAFDAIRFQFIPKEYIELTNPRIPNKPNNVPESQKRRKIKKFFYFLSPKTQAEFRNKFSTKYCWVCRENHSVHDCYMAKLRFGIYENIKEDALAKNCKTGVYLREVENYSKKDAYKILMLFKSVYDEDFKYFMNIDKEFEDIYFCEII